MPTLDCALPDVLLALSGTEVPADVRYVAPPAGFGERPSVAPPPDAKAPYGTNMANHYETANFSINWANGDARDEIAEKAGEALEAGWAALVDAQGWKPPVSSDKYLVWVVLDPSISGTGYTTEYTTDDYPDGYPVIYLNAEYYDYDDFFVALAQHEFDHALQFAQRDYWSGGDDEAWYWEASANWAPYLVGPESSSFDYSAAWYADVPELSYANMNGTHQYGMFVLNAFLDQVVGVGTMQRAWVESADGDDWPVVLETTTGLDRTELWGQFSAAYGDDSLAESGRWQNPERESAENGVAGSAEQLGTKYYRRRPSGSEKITLNMIDGEAVISSSQGVADSLEINGDTTFAVTATSRNGASWTLVLEESTEDTGCNPCDSGDTGLAVDSGSGGDSGGADSNDGGAVTPGPDAPGGCACDGASGLPAGAPLILLVSGWVVRRPRGQIR